jgi:type I restriction enzyme S subunit
MSVSQTLGVVRRSELTDDPPRAESLDDYKVCRPGDIVFNKMSIRDGAMGVAREGGLVTYHYEVMRPRPGADPRYVVYLMKSEWFTGELIQRERGIGAGGTSGVRTTEVPFSVLRTIDAPIPESTAQRAIADYLDAETARIDKVAEAKRGLVRLLRERYWSVADEFFSHYPREQGLGRFAVSMTDGPFGSWLTSAHYAEEDEGGRVIRLGNIGRGVFLDDDRAFVPMHHFTLLKRHEAVAGDLIVAGMGDESHPLGRACVLPEHLGPAIVKADCFRFRLDTDRLLPEFAALFLSCPTGGALVQETTRGSTRQRANLSAVAAVRVPSPPVSDQRHIVVRLVEFADDTARGVAILDRQTDLLRERRQALITAAVTGQIEIPAVAA